MPTVMTPPRAETRHEDAEPLAPSGKSGDERWIEEAIRVCDRAAQGDFEPRILHCDVHTLAGRLGRSINDLLDRADAFVREAGASLECASQDKFYRRLLPNGMVGAYRRAADVINAATEAMAAKSRALAEHQRRRLALAEELESQVGNVVAALAESAVALRTNAQQLAALSQDTTHAAATGLSAAGEAIEHVRHVGLAGEELSESGQAVEQRAHRSHEVAGSAVREAARTGELTRQLGEANQRIGDVVTLIAEIAKHTNLLSLNASIEAARAGEAGRGFAVVATEVRKLADETAGATKRIAKEIEAVQMASRDTSQAITAIEETIQGMNSLAGEINEAMLRQVDLTENIQRRMTETNTCVEQVATAIARTGEAAERTKDTAESLLGSADLVSQQTAALDAAVRLFLDHVRQN